jgi:hypothetical protein
MAVQVFLVREFLHDMRYKLHPTGVVLRRASPSGMDVCVL